MSGICTSFILLRALITSVQCQQTANNGGVDIYNSGKHDEAMNKGDNLYNQGKYDEAINAYDEAIKLDPNDFQNWQAWNGKGKALSTQGKYDEAIQAYDKAIQLWQNNAMVWANKGDALKALGRTNESNVAYATAKELGFGDSTWMSGNNATGITSLFLIQILDHSMASNVDKSTNNVITRTNKFSSTDSKVYSWLSLGNVGETTIYWHWYSPDGNAYKTTQVDIPPNPSAGSWPSYKVWYALDIADIPTEPYLSGNWHVDIYINRQKLLTEQFTLEIGSGTTTISPTATHGTITILDHCMASEIDKPTQSPVTTTKTHEFKDYMKAYSWLRLGNIGVARVEWDWNGGHTISHTFNIPPKSEWWLLSFLQRLGFSRYF